MTNKMTKAEWDAMWQATPANSGARAAVMDAETNAQDTVYAEKSAPEADYYEVCRASLQSILSYSSDKEAIAFFDKIGFKF